MAPADRTPTAARDDDAHYPDDAPGAPITVIILSPDIERATAETSA